MESGGLKINENKLLSNKHRCLILFLQSDCLEKMDSLWKCQVQDLQASSAPGCLVLSHMFLHAPPCGLHDAKRHRDKVVTDRYTRK
ncbi:hypothetical protein Ancab_033542 [Ancistrocladus abbreviatus]